jgi:hypothetical protein
MDVIFIGIVVANEKNRGNEEGPEGNSRDHVVGTSALGCVRPDGAIIATSEAPDKVLP